jgi:CheY-like chemotaxis protein
VDDSASIRQTLSALLGESGHQVRSAENGFSGLGEIRNEVPDIILADLNMPGMSGFEFLSVVLRRFPAVRRIAMGGAYSGDGVPLGVAADAFNEKGSKLASLLNIIDDDELSSPRGRSNLSQRSDANMDSNKPPGPIRGVLRGGDLPGMPQSISESSGRVDTAYQ